MSQYVLSTIADLEHAGHALAKNDTGSNDVSATKAAIIVNIYESVHRADSNDSLMTPNRYRQYSVHLCQH
jgi:hypothetical protein